MGAHEKRLRNFAETAQIRTPSLINLDDDCMREPIQAFVDDKTTKISDSKFQCKECGKCFKALNYVEKHLRKAHCELCEVLPQQAMARAAEDAFLADTSR